MYNVLFVGILLLTSGSSFNKHYKEEIILLQPLTLIDSVVVG